jgi:20S proteasome subunit alpha 7
MVVSFRSLLVFLFFFPYQVEYAMKAVDSSGTVLGVVCSDGVLLAVEKFLLSPMLVGSTNKRIYAVNKHSGIACAGWIPDGRHIVDRGEVPLDVIFCFSS